MKIKYIVNARIPTEKAHGYGIVSLCEQWGMQNHDVKLIVPERINTIKDDVFSYYKIKNAFKVKYIESFDAFRFEKFFGQYTFYLQSLFFLLRLLFVKIDKDAIIYTRNPEIAYIFKKKGHKTVFEAHNWPNSKIGLFRYFLHNIDLIVCNSNGTESVYKENNFKTIVAPNGVNIEEYDIDKGKDELRDELGISKDKKIAMYVGHLYKWKGVDVIITVAEKMREKKDLIFVLIGGTKKDIERYKETVKNKKLNNVYILGHKTKDLIPQYLKCSDILLLPNVPVTEESIRYTSPIKMFEYMASKRPIIASNLPSILEVLNNKNSIICETNDPKDLASKIDDILNNAIDTEPLIAKAYSDVCNYTWEKRAQKIAKYIL